MIELEIDKLEVGDDVFVEKEHLIEHLRYFMQAIPESKTKDTLSSCLAELSLLSYTRIRCIVVTKIRPYTLRVIIQDKNLINNNITVNIGVTFIT